MLLSFWQSWRLRSEIYSSFSNDHTFGWMHADEILFAWFSRILIVTPVISVLFPNQRLKVRFTPMNVHGVEQKEISTYLFKRDILYSFHFDLGKLIIHVTRYLKFTFEHKSNRSLSLLDTTNTFEPSCRTCKVDDTVVRCTTLEIYGSNCEQSVRVKNESISKLQLNRESRLKVFRNGWYFYSSLLYIRLQEI